MAKVQITDTILRDGHQSQAATRMRTDEMLPACEMLDKVGYYSLECWGGATYDACLRFLNEDPWERLRKLRKALPNTKLQMLLRGQNLLGYRPYADDVVDFFVKKAVENGIDIIRCFDALNDLRNMQTAVKATKKYGGTAEIAMSYTESPVHNEDYFVKLAVDIQKMGADVICIKDMANLLLPYKAYSLVKRLKKETDLPIVLHTHNTTGTGDMVLLKAIEAGVDIVDTALSPLGNGTSQPATETMFYALQQYGIKTGLNEDVINKVNDFFKPVKQKYVDSGRINAKSMATDAQALVYKVPGGMLSNMIANLTDMKAMDKFEAALAEIPAVRKDLGYPPLVTPLSQMVGNQAVTNVLLGQRYKQVSKEVKNYFKGEYGIAPAPVSKELETQILGEGGKPVDCRIEDAKRTGEDFKKAKEALGDLARSEEDIMSYICYPDQTMKFLTDRKAKEENICKYSIVEA